MSLFSRLLALTVLSSGPAFAAEPSKLWEVTGLDTPESVLPAPGENFAYVSNVAGQPTDKDGNGFISKISLDGKMIEARWATGLDAPKGLALAGGKLYAADIDRLVEIDTATGKVAQRYDASGAKFLNDVAADGEGLIYVSDMATDTIWRLADGKFGPWLEDKALKAPNGLLVQDGRLIVAGWGTGGSVPNVETPGNLIAVSLTDKSTSDLGSGKPVGMLDGLEPLDATNYLVTDWMNGALLRIGATGEAEQLLDLNQGSADLAYMAADRTALVPMMKDNKSSHTASRHRPTPARSIRGPIKMILRRSEIGSK